MLLTKIIDENIKNNDIKQKIKTILKDKKRN